MQRHMEAVDKGNMGGVEWDFGAYWPSKSQAGKLVKAVLVRNKVWEDARAKKELMRNKARDFHKKEINRWERKEQLRKNEHDNVKKESRKVKKEDRNVEFGTIRWSLG